MCDTLLSEGDTSALSVVILAGGRGERIGGDKAGIAFNGTTLLQQSIASLACLSDDLICVARSDQQLTAPGCSLAYDPPGAVGVLPAMLAGLESARYPWSLVVACDMPFIKVELIRYMLRQARNCDIVVPVLPVGMEPLHALYHRRVLPLLRNAIANGTRRVISFYSNARVYRVQEDEIRRFDPQLLSFFNINTLEDLTQAERWLTHTSFSLRGT